MAAPYTAFLLAFAAYPVLFALALVFMRWDLENEEAQALVENRLRRMGIISALERAGFEPGDDIEIGGTVFTLDPHG